MLVINAWLPKQSGWNFLIASEVTCVRPPVLPPKERWLHLKQFQSLIFSFANIFCPCSYKSFYKNLPFCTTPLSTSLLGRGDAAQFMHHLIKSIRSSNLLGWIFFSTVLNWAIKRNELLIHTITGMNLRIIVLYERNQYCIIPFTHINPPRLQTNL